MISAFTTQERDDVRAQVNTAGTKAAAAPNLH
ncbi:hypothetical protein ILFOPFJJ_03342 [Ensifer psoraleae]|nr:hypothetical protein [Sinorhizobium psoraleae]